MEDYDQMTASRLVGIARFAGSCALVVALLAARGEASSIKRLYVDGFNTESGSEKLRSDVLTELRKYTPFRSSPMKRRRIWRWEAAAEFGSKAIRSLTRDRAAYLPMERPSMMAIRQSNSETKR